MTTTDVLESTSLAELHRLIRRIAERCPELAGRAEKAGLILMGGYVRPLQPDIFEVEGSEGRVYTVDRLAETCDCPDFAHRAPEFKGSKWCKHLLAALLFAHLTKRAAKRDRRARIAVLRSRVRVPLVGRLAV